MVTPTWCHRAKWGNPSWGQWTELTSEFTHFNLVIRLSKVQQLALQLCTILRSPAGPAVPLIPTERISIEWSRAEHSETSYFAAAFAVALHHFMSHVPGRHTTFMWSFSFDGCLVIKHIVHLIRWNLKAVLANWGRLDHGPGKGITHDLQVVRNWVLFFINCFGFLVCHQLVPHLVPNFPRVTSG